jgi:hypothetical protein
MDQDSGIQQQGRSSSNDQTGNHKTGVEGSFGVNAKVASNATESKSAVGALLTRWLDDETASALLVRAES